MSAATSPRELAELTVRRLNRAATDLGLTLRGRPLFALVNYDIPADGDEEAIEVYDIELNAEEIEEYSALATQLEQLAERQVPASPAAQTTGQQNLFESNRLT